MSRRRGRYLAAWRVGRFPMLGIPFSVGASLLFGTTFLTLAAIAVGLLIGYVSVIKRLWLPFEVDEHGQVVSAISREQYDRRVTIGLIGTGIAIMAGIVFIRPLLRANTGAEDFVVLIGGCFIALVSGYTLVFALSALVFARSAKPAKSGMYTDTKVQPRRRRRQR